MYFSIHSGKTQRASSVPNRNWNWKMKEHFTNETALNTEQTYNRQSFVAHMAILPGLFLCYVLQKLQLWTVPWAEWHNALSVTEWSRKTRRGEQRLPRNRRRRAGKVNTDGMVWLLDWTANQQNCQTSYIYRIFVRKPHGKWQFGRTNWSRHRRKNITITEINNVWHYNRKHVFQDSAWYVKILGRSRMRTTKLCNSALTG
jgi:hypothetical protein